MVNITGRPHYKGGVPPELVLIDEKPIEHLRLLKVISHAHPIAEWKWRGPHQIERAPPHLDRTSRLLTTFVRMVLSVSASD